MNISERLAREAYDRLNPWRPMSDAKPDGTVCELQFNDMVGAFETDRLRYFLDHDGRWYRIDPPSPVYARAIGWRPACARLSSQRRHHIKQQARRR